MSILCRLIHVSDLHFGDTLSTPWYAVTSWIPGLETHSKRVAQALSDSVRFQHLSPPDPWHVIATGDLTTWGRPAAFSLVLTYLRSQIFVGGQRVWLGLNVPGASVIPGNHDIWSGTLLGLSSIAQIPPSTRADFAQFFTLPAPGATYPKNNAQFPTLSR